MSDQLDQLTRAARQLVAIDELLGGVYIPRKRNPLPPPVQRQAAQAVGGEALGAAQVRPTAQAVAPRPAPVRRAAATAVTIPEGELTFEQKCSLLGQMDDAEVKICNKCVLCQGRSNTVFGEGSPDARLMFVGEAPGQEEDLSGRPFVGAAGQLLAKMITAMGLSREEVYIANVLKCRPPGNRAPTPEEAEKCWSFLLRQIQVIHPQVIVTLGNPATHRLLDTKAGIMTLRGTWQSLPEWAPGIGGIKVMPTLHPSYVLRAYTPEVRGKVWSDLQQVMKELGLKVPEGK